ncbi:MAG: IS1595 family transposase [Roseococcus sp.]|nr:IS1595 family transposase [Roseococcus sp.]
MKRKPRTKLPLSKFKSLFETDEKCRAFLEQASWGDTPACAHCGSVKVWRRTKRHLFECGDCGKQFSVLVGTPMQDTKLPLTKWFLAIYLLAETSKGVSANWLKDAIGVTYKTAWFLGHRIRRMMDGGDTLLTGVVEADETYMGGKRRRGDPPRKRGRGTPKKAVFVAVQRGGQVRAGMMENVTADAVKARLDEWVSKDATLMTDELNVYRGLGRIYGWHFSVNHNAEEFVRDVDGLAVHNNSAESFNSTLKRAHTGVYHYMSPKHLLRYVSECAFRWNARKMDTLGRLSGMLHVGFGRVIPYKVLTAQA